MDPSRSSAYRTLYKKDVSISGSVPVIQNVVAIDDLPPKEHSLSALHSHEFIEISCVVGGCGIHRVWNEETVCGRGDMYILNSGVPHGYFARSGTERPVVHNVLFDPADFFDEAFADAEHPYFCCGIFSGNADYTYLPLEEGQFGELEALSHGIGREIGDKKDLWFDCVRARLTVYLIAIRRLLSAREGSGSASEGNARHRAITAEMVRYVTEHFADPGCTLDAVARDRFMSKSYLSRIFHNVTGTYFADYMRDVRMKHARLLLEETRLTNEQIAYACGFRDVPAFYGNFRAVCHMTPYRYRKSAAEEGGADNRRARCVPTDF
jgi:AraC-like DNA-binding protein